MSNYLIWREKNGFFYAIDYNYLLCMWSLFTGERLYKKQLDKPASIKDNEKYLSIWHNWTDCPSKIDYTNYTVNIIKN